MDMYGTEQYNDFIIRFYLMNLWNKLIFKTFLLASTIISAGAIDLFNTAYADESADMGCITLKFDGSNDDIDYLAQSVIESPGVKQYIYNFESSIYNLDAGIAYFLPSVSLSFSTSYNINPSYETTIFNTGTYSDLDRSNESQKSLTTTNYIKFYDNTPILTASIPVIDVSQLYNISYLRLTSDSLKNESAYQAIENINSVVDYYFNYIEKSQVASATIDVINSLEKSVSDVQLLYNSGQRSLIDLLSLQQQLNSYKSSYDSTLAGMETIKGNIESLISTNVCPNSSSLAIKNYSLDDIDGIQLQFFIDSLDLALTSYPQLKYIGLNRDAAKQLAKSYAANYLPSLSLSANLETAYSYGNPGGISSDPYQYWNISTNYVMATATWDIFDGGQNYLQMKSEQKLSESYNQEFLQAQQSLTSIYKSALKSDSDYIKARTSILVSLDEAIRSQELVEIAYKAGYKSYLDIINSVQSVYDSISALANIYSLYAQNRYTLLGYLGYPNLNESNKKLLNIQIRGKPE